MEASAARFVPSGRTMASNHFSAGTVDPFAGPGNFFSSMAQALLATAFFRCWHILLFFTAWATAISLINNNVRDLSIQPTLLTVVGTVLGFVISYRTTSSFERYNEGRRYWSQIILASRTLARAIWFHVPDLPPPTAEDTRSEAERRARVLVEKKTAINLIQAFAVAVKHYLRGEDGIHYVDLYHLVKFLPSYALPAGFPAHAVRSELGHDDDDDDHASLHARRGFHSADGGVGVAVVDAHADDADADADATSARGPAPLSPVTEASERSSLAKSKRSTSGDGSSALGYSSGAQTAVVSAAHLPLPPSPDRASGPAPASPNSAEYVFVGGRGEGERERPGNPTARGGAGIAQRRGVSYAPAPVHPEPATSGGARHKPSFFSLRSPRARASSASLARTSHSQSQSQAHPPHAQNPAAPPALLPAALPPRYSVFDIFPLSLLVKLLSRRGRAVEGKKAARYRARRGVVGHNVPLEVSLYLSSYLSALNARKSIDVPTSNLIIATINQLTDALTGLERILTTPIPFSYSIHLWLVTIIYCLALPFQIWTPLKWLTIPGTAIASFVFFGFLVAGEEIENPFGYDKNDLNMDHFTHNIIRNELLAITSRAPPDPAEWAFSQHNDCLFPAAPAGEPDADADADEKRRDRDRDLEKGAYYDDAADRRHAHDGVREGVTPEEWVVRGPAAIRSAMVCY